MSGDFDYEPRQEAFYHGDCGAVYRVRVLKNNSDSDHERYFLTILEVLQGSTSESRTLEVGDEFERGKPRHTLKDIPERFSWELLDEEETDRRLAS